MVMLVVFTIDIYEYLCNTTPIEQITLVKDVIIELQFVCDVECRLIVVGESITNVTTLLVEIWKYDTNVDELHAWMRDESTLNCSVNQICSKETGNGYSLDEYWSGDCSINKDLRIKFTGHVSNASVLELEILQKEVILRYGESTLVFYRIYNPMGHDVTCFGLYFVYPDEASANIHKIQCFCYNDMVIKAHETVDLPILFYVDAYADTYVELIQVSYIIFVKE